MTTTTITEAAEQVTLTTPEGTIVRLIDSSYMTAETGALAVVGDGSGLHGFGGYLDVRWLSGHHTQNDGGYPPRIFELFEFQIGDRVVVTSLHEQGYEGYIETIPANNGDDCIVAVDSGSSLSYKFKNLVKVEEPAPAPFQPGDIVVITSAIFNERWVDQRFVVKDVDPTSVGGRPFLENGSIDTRPDGFKGNFFWDLDKLRAFDPARDFRVGDLVEATRYGSWGNPAKGVVTALEGDFNGDIEINWTDGIPPLVESGPIGATYGPLRLVGVAPQPIRSDFDFEVGQEIGSSEVLDDLPMGTALVINGDVASPVIKLENNFGRFNRYGTDLGGHLRSYLVTEQVAEAADGEGALIIAYVPSV